MGRKPGCRPGRSVLRAYVRTRTRPGDRARREKTPAAPNHSRVICPSRIAHTAIPPLLASKQVGYFRVTGEIDHLMRVGEGEDRGDGL
jgi:hypothetical protein